MTMGRLKKVEMLSEENAHGGLAPAAAEVHTLTHVLLATAAANDSSGLHAHDSCTGSTMTPALLSADEVCSYLSLCRSRIYALIKTNGFPAPLKLGKTSRWMRREVDEWIAGLGRVA